MNLERMEIVLVVAIACSASTACTNAEHFSSISGQAYTGDVPSGTITSTGDNTGDNGGGDGGGGGGGGGSGPNVIGSCMLVRSQLPAEAESANSLVTLPLAKPQGVYYVGFRTVTNCEFSESNGQLAGCPGVNDLGDILPMPDPSNNFFAPVSAVVSTAEGTVISSQIVCMSNYDCNQIANYVAGSDGILLAAPKTLEGQVDPLNYVAFTPSAQCGYNITDPAVNGGGTNLDPLVKLEKYWSER